VERTEMEQDVVPSQKTNLPIPSPMRGYGWQLTMPRRSGTMPRSTQYTFL
jgi:hypothetical protein